MIHKITLSYGTDKTFFQLQSEALNKFILVCFYIPRNPRILYSD
jgi:hypothetical protein